MIFKILEILFHKPKHISRIKTDLKPCFYCGKLFKSQCRKYANDIQHNCPHGVECNSLQPK